MRRNFHRVILLQAMAGVMAAQTGPPPPPPPPPAFMGMKTFQLSCFSKPNFEEAGVEIFVCNGGGGMAGFRKKSGPSHIVFVRDADIAQNLNMQAAKGVCGKRFAVADSGGMISFQCDGKEIDLKAGFKPAAKAEWVKYANYMAK